MAWRCSALIENLANASILKNPRVISAMKKVDRKDFCPRDPYEDSPQTIGYAATISAPHMHGYALDQLEPFLQPGMKGSGSGYLCACMAEMVGPTGKVIGIEHIPELVTSSTRNLNKNYRDQMESKQIEIIEGDGREGYEKEAPYDCIHVGAAAPTTPEALIQQLKSPGRKYIRLFVPVGTDSQHIVLYDKDEHGNVSEKKWLGVMYIPLTDAKKQRRSIYE
ncbi:Protein-L-isoaspartate(D-aspartate) O-methyltransferase [Choanephora cucurbitarum]|uniref:Protein-L-isoaspartate O-methyltransferase n=1 Tax=Choanephora cucurbitarum TaxID=101091 RepID=A0A1C7N3T8_9FUNG|nr:Protein-L-isoaspartate(D-aspartate) O-methyltransferase [Choanephora cucurbitarum]